MAEFIGILLEDGGLTPSQIQISLNSMEDRKYGSFISSLGTNSFRVKPSILERKACNTVVVYYGGLNLVECLISLGLKTGNKVKQQIDVPDWIKSASDFRAVCLRGLMDTDDGVFLHKYKGRSKIYRYKKNLFFESIYTFN